MRVMSSASSTRYRDIMLSTAIGFAVLAWCPPALALNAALDVSQYAHTAWTTRDGFSLGNIYAIAQTPDGYLWFGGELGLARFDGVRGLPVRRCHVTRGWVVARLARSGLDASLATRSRHSWGRGQLRTVSTPTRPTISKP